MGSRTLFGQADTYAHASLLVVHESLVFATLHVMIVQRCRWHVSLVLYATAYRQIRALFPRARILHGSALDKVRFEQDFPSRVAPSLRHLLLLNDLLHLYLMRGRHGRERTVD